MNMIPLLLCSAMAGSMSVITPAVTTSQSERDALMQKFTAYIKNYKPDYSDSSNYMLPPAENRFDTPLPLVKNGVPVAEIHLDNALALPPDITAAEELQKAVQDITGAKLRIVKSWGGVVKRKSATPRIFLGKSFYADGDVLKKLSGTDGYAIARNGNDLFLYGYNAKGVLNGVYALIENNTDIIWARPHARFGTVYSQSKDLSLVWGDNVVDKPASISRGWNGYADREWMARNKCNGFYGGGGGDISWTNAGKAKYGVREVLHLFGHNIGHFVYYRKYFKDHPEYYSLVGGQRRPWRQYCFTNEGMKKVFIENALDFMRHAPENTDGMHIDMDDTWDACECSGCTAPIRLKDGSMLTVRDPAFRSTQYFMFLNEVVAATKKEFPRIFIKTLAYFSTATAPECDVDPMIRPTYAPYVRANDKRPIFAPENSVWLDRLESWRKKSEQIDCYEYYGLGLEFPRPLAEVRKFDIPIMYRSLLGMGSEYRQNGDRDTGGGQAAVWDYSAMEYWVLTRLLWNPDQDVEKLRKYYLRRTFREAAPMMERFYGLIRSGWFQNNRASTCGDNPVELTKLFIIDSGREKEMRKILEDARGAAKHPVSSELVKRVAGRFEHFVKEAKAIRTPSLSVPLLRPNGTVGFDSPLWLGAAEISAFNKCYAKGALLPVDHPSSVRVFHDYTNLYVYAAFQDKNIGNVVCKTPPAGLEKDYIPESDHVEIFVGDQAAPETYYLFSLAPNGISAELKGHDYKWNGKWTREVRRRADGWDILMILPLSTVNADIAKSSQLRFQILREYHRHADGSDKREYSSWGGGGHHQSLSFGTLNLMR